MGMSYHIAGFRPPNNEWLKKKNAWEACVEAAIEIPEELREFFGDEDPDARGVIIRLEEMECVRKYETHGESGFEVDLKKLPKDLKIIRFSCMM